MKEIHIIYMNIGHVLKICQNNLCNGCNTLAMDFHEYASVVVDAVRIYIFTTDCLEGLRSLEFFDLRIVGS